MNNVYSTHCELKDYKITRIDQNTKLPTRSSDEFEETYQNIIMALRASYNT